MIARSRGRNDTLFFLYCTMHFDKNNKVKQKKTAIIMHTNEYVALKQGVALCFSFIFNGFALESK